MIVATNPAFPGRAGSGERFAACVAEMSGRRGVRDPRGVCASIGRRKYGARQFARMAAAGRRGNPQLVLIPLGSGLGFLPVLAYGAVALATAGLAYWGGSKVIEQDLREGLEREGKGVIDLPPPPAPAAPQSTDEMCGAGKTWDYSQRKCVAGGSGAWTPERLAEENAKLWKQYVLDAPKSVSWKPWEPGELGEPTDWKTIALWVAAGVAAASVLGLVLKG